MENPCTAADKAPYGIGMKNVEETVKKYSGTLHTELKDGKYMTDVILYGIGIRHSREVCIVYAPWEQRRHLERVFCALMYRCAAAE